MKLRLPTGEKFNSISHMLGAIASLVGLIFLIYSSSRKGNPWEITGVSIYGATLLFLFLTSTLYHSISGTAKRIFHKMDHLAIYLLIAGTYTPIALVTLHGVWGWLILSLIWGLALTGIIVDLFSNAHGRRIVPMIIYIVMGWLIVIAYQPMTALFHPDGLKLLFIGGILYSAGIIFFLYDKKVRHFHGIWHLFVLGGSFSHFLAIYIFL